MDGIAVALECAFYGKTLDVNVGSVERSELRWEGAHRTRMNAGSIHQTRDLDTGIGSEILDVACLVVDVQIESARCPRLE